MEEERWEITAALLRDIGQSEDIEIDGSFINISHDIDD